MPTKHSPREALELMLGHLGFAFEIQEEQRPIGHTLHIRTRTPAKLIGRDGKILEELQFLLNRILSSKEDEVRHQVIIDVENYRIRQQEILEEELDYWINEVRRTGKPAQFPPLNSFDRRIIHLVCKKKHPDFETHSDNTPGKFKRITVCKKGEQEPPNASEKESS